MSSKSQKAREKTVARRQDPEEALKRGFAALLDIYYTTTQDCTADATSEKSEENPADRSSRIGGNMAHLSAREMLFEQRLEEAYLIHIQADRRAACAGSQTSGTREHSLTNHIGLYSDVTAELPLNPKTSEGNSGKSDQIDAKRLREEAQRFKALREMDIHTHKSLLE